MDLPRSGSPTIREILPRGILLGQSHLSFSSLMSLKHLMSGSFSIRLLRSPQSIQPSSFRTSRTIEEVFNAINSCLEKNFASLISDAGFIIPPVLLAIL